MNSFRIILVATCLLLIGMAQAMAGCPDKFNPQILYSEANFENGFALEILRFWQSPDELPESALVPFLKVQTTRRASRGRQIRHILVLAEMDGAHRNVFKFSMTEHENGQMTSVHGEEGKAYVDANAGHAVFSSEPLADLMAELITSKYIFVEEIAGWITHCRKRDIVPLFRELPLRKIEMAIHNVLNQAKHEKNLGPDFSPVPNIEIFAHRRHLPHDADFLPVFSDSDLENEINIYQFDHFLVIQVREARSERGFQREELLILDRNEATVPAFARVFRDRLDEHKALIPEGSLLASINPDAEQRRSIHDTAMKAYRQFAKEPGDAALLRLLQNVVLDYSDNLKAL